MQRWVLHIDMDAFFASVEQLTRPTLRGRPVLVGGLGGRGVVAGASYEAREKGARSAMPMFRAQQLIGPRGVVVYPRFSIYQAASQRVFEIISAQVDVVEQLSIDEGFMEPTQLVGASPETVREWADELRTHIFSQTGLPSSVGAGAGKQSAKIGSGLAKPDGTWVIPAREETEILHPLPVGKLWGVGPVTAAKLKSVGIETIGDLAAMSEKEVQITLGTTIGTALWKMANGIDERVVAPRSEAKQISQENTYGQDLLTPESVDAAVERAFTGAHRRLLKDGRGARTISVKLRMADFHIESRSTTLAYATTDYDTLKASAFSLVRYPNEVGPIRLVGVSFSGLESAQQDVLFPELDQVVRARLAAEKSAANEYEPGVSDGIPAALGPASHNPGAHADGHDSEPEATDSLWLNTQDVVHAEFGHGWVQGTGHGKVSVRFETRTTGPGKTMTFRIDDDQLSPGDPLESLDWSDWLASRSSREE